MARALNQKSGQTVTQTAIQEDTMTTDPVCGMQVDEKTAPAKTNYGGKTYYFCSQDCADDFTKDPAKYTKTAAAAR